jgi:phosphoglycerate dehydrogenase-like enzyme
MIRIAILDDYQNVALQMADWSPLAGRAEITVFNDHLSDFDEVVERLLLFDVVCVMRERTPLTRAVIERLPRLKLIASTGPRNAAIDVEAQACGARLITKEDLFRNADIVTIHIVLSDRTRGLVGAAELLAMKPSARLINTSRGPIVNEPALIEVLRERRIAGAALDVFDIEPLPADHPFRSLDNVLATPHIGYVARDLYRTFYGDTVKNITRWLD